MEWRNLYISHTIWHLLILLLQCVMENNTLIRLCVHIIFLLLSLFCDPYGRLNPNLLSCTFLASWSDLSCGHPRLGAHFLLSTAPVPESAQHQGILNIWNAAICNSTLWHFRRDPQMCFWTSADLMWSKAPQTGWKKSTSADCSVHTAVILNRCSTVGWNGFYTILVCKMIVCTACASQGDTAMFLLLYFTSILLLKKINITKLDLENHYCES